MCIWLYRTAFVATTHDITRMHRDAELKECYSGDVPVVLTQVMLLLTSSADCPTAHTVNVYRDPGRRLATVITFWELLWSTPAPTSLYDLADIADCHENVREFLVELTALHDPEILGPKSENVKFKTCTMTTERAETNARITTKIPVLLIFVSLTGYSFRYSLFAVLRLTTHCAKTRTA